MYVYILTQRTVPGNNATLGGRTRGRWRGGLHILTPRAVPGNSTTLSDGGGVMALVNHPVPGRPTIWMIVGQGPIALAVGAGWGLFRHFLLSSILRLLSSFSLSLGDGPI